MKRVLLLLLFIGVLATACDPEWALNPQNEGRAYIVNKTDADIIFRGYTSWGVVIYRIHDFSMRYRMCFNRNLG